MFATAEELECGLEYIKSSPKKGGVVRQIVCRPEVGERRVIDRAQLDVREGLVGDNWLARGDKKSPDGTANPDMQLNLMNARAIELIAKTSERWALAGDQFFVDLDLSKENLPAGTLLKIGEATIQITAEPHLGCKKFLERFGKAAVMFVNSDEGKRLNLRGVNAKVIEAGEVSAQAVIEKMS